MTSSELRKYMGGKTACDSCGHLFEEGKRIMVNPDDGYIFCYSLARDGCVAKHPMAMRKITVAIAMIFGGPLDDRMESVRRILDDWEEETPV